jgi:hypothetical protein
MFTSPLTGQDQNELVDVAPTTTKTALMLVDDFNATFRKPLDQPILVTPPRARPTRAKLARARGSAGFELALKSCTRLAAKSKHHAKRPEDQCNIPEFQTSKNTTTKFFLNKPLHGECTY